MLRHCSFYRDIGTYKEPKAFLDNINRILKRGGGLILSTPNKMYASPFLLKPLNPYHTREYYLGELLKLLDLHGFKVCYVYGGKRIGRLELLRRIFGSLVKFLLSNLSIKTSLIDDLYHSVSALLRLKTVKETMLVDPNPDLVIHEKLKTTSNIVVYQYLIIYATKR